MIVYILKRKNHPGDFHLFVAAPALNDELVAKQKSICKEMDKSESVENMFGFQPEVEARLICARLGRDVCGTCVSHLYETLED